MSNSESKINFSRPERDFINEFLLFIVTKDPYVVSRILKDMNQTKKCGNAPKIALEILKIVRRKVVIKQLLNIPKDDLLAVLLDSDNKKLIELIRDLTNDFAKCKQEGGRRSPRRSRRSPRKKRQSPCYKNKVERVMGEFKRGKLRSSSGTKVKTRTQAIAIALNSADRKCR